jgi:hypothetical protein
MDLTNREAHQLGRIQSQVIRSLETD